MRRLPGTVVLLLVTSASACLPFGAQRSKPRVSEIETTTRGGGDATSQRTRVDYRSDGRVEEITRTVDGDFLERWELSYDSDGRVEEILVLGDDDTLVLEVSWTGDLLTEARARVDDAAQDWRWDVSYRDGDRRFVDSVVTTVEASSYSVETSATYRYDEASRIEEIVTSVLSDFTSGGSSESKMETDLRYDADTGRLERVTLTTEVPVVAVPETDWCADVGYYGDGVCDSDCPLPDPDCGDSGDPLPEPGGSSTEYERDTTLYSVKYDDVGRLEEMDGPGGETYVVDYDDDGRIEEVERRGDGYTITTAYTYDDGTVTGHSFAPAMPNGQFFDLIGASFGTLEVESPLQILGELPSSGGSGPGSAGEVELGF